MRRTIEISMSEECLGTGPVGAAPRTETRERRTMRGKAAKPTLSKDRDRFPAIPSGDGWWRQHPVNDPRLPNARADAAAVLVWNASQLPGLQIHGLGGPRQPSDQDRSVWDISSNSSNRAPHIPAWPPAAVVSGTGGRLCHINRVPCRYWAVNEAEAGIAPRPWHARYVLRNPRGPAALFRSGPHAKCF